MLRSVQLTWLVCMFIAGLHAPPCSAKSATESDDDGFVLHMLPKDSEGKCLDGTPGGFYHYSGIGTGADNWIIHIEGGGWCINEIDCIARSKTAIGSSTGWPRSGLPSMDGGAHGILSSDPKINPDFHNWNKAHLNYCDGASFAGFVADPVQINGTQLHFRGRKILDDSINQLRALGMENAKNVIVKGCSAGGLATYLHIDYIRSRIPQSVHVVGAPDSGFFLDIDDWTGAPSYTPNYKYIANMQNVTANVNQDCVASYDKSEHWKCFMAQYTLPYIKTPLFIWNSMEDAWQMANILRLPCYENISSCTEDQLSAFKSFRTTMLAQLHLGVNNATMGLFLESCVIHGLSNSDNIWPHQVVGNQTMKDTFGSWFFHRGLKSQVVDGPWPGDNPCLPFR